MKGNGPLAIKCHPLIQIKCGQFLLEGGHRPVSVRYSLFQFIEQEEKYSKTFSESAT